MSFWGIVVKPGKAVIHSKKKGGKLRVSQATIGFGEGSEKSVVVCKVGNREGVFVCSLVPDKIEFCHLELEFQEKDDLVFSVIGPRNVHLSGYYIELPFPSISDSESLGGNTDDSDTSSSSNTSQYGGSFIDDDDDVAPAAIH